MNPLFTIGHSTHDVAKFLGLLKQHEIEVVADVRSRPFSRFPWFSSPALKRELKANGLCYVFLGDELGARRVEREVYIGSRADYELIARKWGGDPWMDQQIILNRHLLLHPRHPRRELRIFGAPL